MKWIAIFMLAWTLATGCASGPERPGSEKTIKTTLEGTRWRLTAWAADASDPSPFAITADFGTTQISGNAAVNRYGGPYLAHADGAFEVGPLNATRRGGSEQAMHAESLYFDFLQQARRYALTASTLTLMDANQQNLLIFQARSTPPGDLDR